MRLLEKKRHPERSKKIKGNRVTLASNILIIFDISTSFTQHVNLESEELCLLVPLFLIIV